MSSRFRTRHFIAFVCGALILLRAVFPDLRIDEVSLWLLTLGAIVLLIPDIGDVLARISKIKKGDLEVEFETKLKHLRERTAEAESSIDAGELRFEELPDEVAERIYSSLVEPRAALISIAVEIEDRLRHLAKVYEIQLRGRFFSPRRALEALIEAKKIDPQVKGLFEDYWSIRNEAMHGQFVVTDDAHLFALVDLGITVLRLIYSAEDS